MRFFICIIALRLCVYGLSTSCYGQSLARSINPSKISKEQKNIINLAGQWHFQMDAANKGIQNKWYKKKLSGSIHLPGSMVGNDKGNPVTIHTNWTGSIRDSSFYYDPRLAKYRKKNPPWFPFFLTPRKHYVGAAWYQKDVTIPDSWKNRHIQLFLERAHWQTQVWIDNTKIGMKNSLSTPQVYDLSKVLKPGKHRITIRVDNSINDVGINVGPDSHSVSDQTQGNWNGIVGRLQLISTPDVWLSNVQVYPDVKQKKAKVRVTVKNSLHKNVNVNIALSARSINSSDKQDVKPLSSHFSINSADTTLTINYPMGEHVQKWSAIHPNLYRLKAKLSLPNGSIDTKKVQFGMRNFTIQGTRFAVNGKPIFIRGTVNNANFPLTGHPPMTESDWLRIFRIAKSYGLNAMRFHSWCPPEAAFDAADKVGFYLQIEGPSWANHGTSLGDGRPIDQYIYKVTNLIGRFYGNHPSFCMMAYGNEPAGGHQVQYLNKFVDYWKAKDSRHVYTGASDGGHWPLVPEEQYLVKSNPRGVPWDKKRPGTEFDHRSAISAFNKPYIAHEVGQYDAFPDFSNIPEYTGVHKPRNLKLFRAILRKHHMGDEAHKFLMASGKLQTLFYKGEIEAALRTPGFAGFFLLSLNDDQGQGTSLVGVLNTFWQNKGYVNASQFQHFCNTTVPLARIKKFVYNNNETFNANLEIAHFGAGPMDNAHPYWQIQNADGKVIASGKLPSKKIPIGNNIPLGNVHFPLQQFHQATHLKLIVGLKNTPFKNGWNFWVYPKKQVQPDQSNIYFTHSLDQKAENVLKNGGKVFLEAAGKVRKGKDVKMGFQPAFWNTSWYHMRPPQTLGVLVKDKSPAFKYFPTSYHSDFQWWSIVNHAQVMWLQNFPKNFRPLVQPIDTYFLNRRLGLIFQARVDGGKLMVSSADLMSNSDKRPAARQLLYSLTRYMQSDQFKPKTKVSLQAVKKLFEKGPGDTYKLYFRQNH
ncbi:MAG TPA: glycoside hydrolase family 2 TIM barrel-domain containing protein [Balneolaceae bacterium]|nr:glycoside hydrolase family 2 TIM barrel-domain containing protein [Balneolaceae bacterium]